MSPIDRRLTWYEKQKKRKSSPFFRLLQQSFTFRLILAGAIALAILATVNRFETCRLRGNRPDCIFYDPWSIISVSNIESYSIVTAALLYILEKKRHRQEKHEEALDRLMNARQLGIVHSLARIDALETLNEDGFPLDGLDLQGADLEGLSLPYGSLRGANLSRTVLIRADLRGTDLTGANLSGTDLTGANLADAIVTGTILDRTGTSD